MGYQKLFHEIDPPEDFNKRISEHISRLRVQRAQIRFAVSGGTALASLGAIIPAFSYFSAKASSSGFSEYLSLIQTDSDIFLLHSKEFILSLSETIPLTALTILLLIVFLLFWSLPRITSSARIAFNPPQKFVLS